MIIQTLPAGGEESNAKVARSLEDHLFHFIRRHDVKHELGVPVLFFEAVHGLREAARRVEHRIVDDADVQPAGRLPG